MSLAQRASKQKPAALPSGPTIKLKLDKNYRSRLEQIAECPSSGLSGVTTALFFEGKVTSGSLEECLELCMWKAIHRLYGLPGHDSPTYRYCTKTLAALFLAMSEKDLLETLNSIVEDSRNEFAKT